MVLKYLGRLETSVKASGCSKCGNRSPQSSGLTRTTYRKVALPSGAIIDVRVGRKFEVSSSDGLFLLNQYYVVGGKSYQEFEVV